MTSKTVTVRLNNAMRYEIETKVLRDTFRARVEKLNKEAKEYCQAIVDKGHAKYFEMHGDPKLEPYMTRCLNDGDFKFYVDDAKEPHSMSRLHLGTKEDKDARAYREALRISDGYRAGPLTVRGPSGERYGNDLIPVKITPNQAKKLQRLADEMKQLVKDFDKFKGELVSILFASTTLVDLYKAIPELKKITGLNETKVLSTSTALVLPKESVMAEMKTAGLVA